MRGMRRAGAGAPPLLIVGLIGAALLYGDGVITPAISVLSAVEGIEGRRAAARARVVPVTLAILVGSFLVQRRGTGFIGSMFGPVMMVWFLMLAGSGVGGIVRAPGVLAALSPNYAR